MFTAQEHQLHSSDYAMTHLRVRATSTPSASRSSCLPPVYTSSSPWICSNAPAAGLTKRHRLGTMAPVLVLTVQQSRRAGADTILQAATKGHLIRPLCRWAADFPNTANRGPPAYIVQKATAANLAKPLVASISRYDRGALHMGTPPRRPLLTFTFLESLVRPAHSTGLLSSPRSLRKARAPARPVPITCMNS